MIVYAITNTRNGKRYIGMTEMTLGKRWYHHLYASKGGVRTALYSAIRKYGEAAFEIEEICSVLPSLSRDDLCEVERCVIAQEGTLLPAGYNMTPGGEGVPKGYKPSAIALANRWTPERRAELVEANKARAGQPSPKRGVAMTQEQRAKMAANWTPEKRAAFSEQLRELAASRPKRISPKKGKPMSEEQRSKLRDAWARNPQRRADQSARNIADDLISYAHKVRKAA